MFETHNVVKNLLPRPFGLLFTYRKQRLLKKKKTKINLFFYSFQEMHVTPTNAVYI